jgi:pSer/pThr/pTyr-binding forkhead associated (FHA) protein
MMSQPPRPGQPNPSGERFGTLLETEEDIRQALLSGLKGQPLVPASPPPAAKARPATPQSIPTAGPPPAPPVAVRSASPFRPTARPPIALLTVFDDGRIEGEVIRLREPRFLIGRTEGDLRIPLDSRMSARHVEITYQQIGGLHRWVLTDLQSTHGLFVRVSRTVLADQAEFLVGNGRYRFDAPQASSGSTANLVVDQPVSGLTHGWSGGPSPVRPPALTELLGPDIGNRMLLVKHEYWIGSDPSCPICRPDDPFCEPRHVRVYRKPNGGWHAEHNKTPNGLWLRMSQITVESLVQFQIGEQRFQLKVP